MIHRIEFIILLFSFFTINVNSQKKGIDYVTAYDTLDLKHNITFNNDNTVTIKYPRGPGVLWDSIIDKPITLSFSNHGDTIKIYSVNDTLKLNINETEKRILNSKFIEGSKGQLFDLNSDYIYVTKRQSNKTKFGVVSLEGKLYILRKRGNSALRKKIKRINIDDYETKIYRGVIALKKYGAIGINGVIELKKK